MNFENIGAIMYLLSIPLFVIGLIVLIVQAIRKKKKKIPIITIVVSLLLCVSGIFLPALDELNEISSLSSSSVAKENVSKEIAETIAKQEIVNLCCDNSYVSSVNITYGTFDVSESPSGGYEFDAKGTYFPIDDYGTYGNRKKFNIRLKVADDGKTTVLVETYQ